MTYIPIIIPRNNEPDRCPSCHGIEDVKITCKHCGHEYQESDDTGMASFLVFTLIAIFFIWFVFTMLMWLSPSNYHDTLFDVLKNEWSWLISKQLY